MNKTNDNSDNEIENYRKDKLLSELFESNETVSVNDFKNSLKNLNSEVDDSEKLSLDNL